MAVSPKLPHSQRRAIQKRAFCPLCPDPGPEFSDWRRRQLQGGLHFSSWLRNVLGCVATHAHPPQSSSQSVLRRWTRLSSRRIITRWLSDHGSGGGPFGQPRRFPCLGKCVKGGEKGGGTEETCNQVFFFSGPCSALKTTPTGRGGGRWLKPSYVPGRLSDRATGIAT